VLSPPEEFKRALKKNKQTNNNKKKTTLEFQTRNDVKNK